MSIPRLPPGRDSTLGGDILRYGAAIALALGFSVVQVFVIPRRMSVETYGEYRVFLLYIGYLGLLHFGLVDGAFLRWVGRPIPLIRDEWPRVFRRVLAWQSVPVATFAFYGFASSVMSFAGGPQQTLSRVALAHAARRAGGARACRVSRRLL